MDSVCMNCTLSYELVLPQTQPKKTSHPLSVGLRWMHISFRMRRFLLTLDMTDILCSVYFNFYTILIIVKIY